MSYDDLTFCKDHKLCGGALNPQEKVGVGQARSVGGRRQCVEEVQAQVRGPRERMERGVQGLSFVRNWDLSLCTFSLFLKILQN